MSEGLAGARPGPAFRRRSGDGADPGPVPRASALATAALVVALAGLTLPAHAADGLAQFDLVSRQGAHDYRIFVDVPRSPPPASGYPVLYVTDGNESCPLAAAIAGTLSDHVIARPLIVCIGYPDTDAATHWNARVRDLTDPPRRSFHGGAWPGLESAGGADAFADFLQNELKPVIRARYAVDTGREVLFGHSLGGWFALHAFLTHPERYASFIAGSPSLFWNEDEILDGIDHVAPGPGPRLLVVVGSLEDSVDEAPPRKGGPGIDYRMVPRFETLATLLRRRLPTRSRARLIEGECHSSALAPELDHGLLHAFGIGAFAAR